MKFKAEFDSVNSADLAAAKIRRTISPFSDVKVIQSHLKTDSHFGGLTAAFGNCSPTIGPNMYVFPIPYTSDPAADTSSPSGKVTLEVTCRSQDRNEVSSIIIGSGGYDIHEINYSRTFPYS